MQYNTCSSKQEHVYSIYNILRHIGNNRTERLCLLKFVHSIVISHMLGQIEDHLLRYHFHDFIQMYQIETLKTIYGSHSPHYQSLCHHYFNLFMFFGIENVLSWIMMVV